MAHHEVEYLTLTGTLGRADKRWVQALDPSTRLPKAFTSRAEAEQRLRALNKQGIPARLVRVADDGMRTIVRS